MGERLNLFLIELVVEKRQGILPIRPRADARSGPVQKKDHFGSPLAAAIVERARLAGLNFAFCDSHVSNLSGLVVFFFNTLENLCSYVRGGKSAKEIGEVDDRG